MASAQAAERLTVAHVPSQTIHVRWSRLKGRLAPPSARKTAYVTAIGIGGTIVTVTSLYDLSAAAIGWPLIALISLTILSGCATLRLPGIPVSFSISDSFTITAALLFGPAAGTAAVVLDALAISWRLARSNLGLQRLLFNTAAPALAMWLAARCFFAMVGGHDLIHATAPLSRLFGPLVVFTVLYFVLNSGVVAGAVAIEQRKPLVAIWRRHFLPLWLTHFGGAAVAVLLMTLVQTRGADLTVLALVAPIPFILYATFKSVVGRIEDQIGHFEQVNRMHLATIETLAHAIDAKDQVTHGHIRRVQHLAMRLAAALDIKEERERRAIEAASLLHDIGKLAIPEHILNKPGKLTAAEFEKMKEHARIGAEILSSIDFPYPVEPIVRHHHENWDGTGYPAGLKGEDIPIGARILQVVDCFDALTSDRPYRPKMTSAEAIAIVFERSGTMYDPRVVATFVDTHADEEPAAAATSMSAALSLIVETVQSDAAARRASSNVGALVPLVAAMYDLGGRIARDVAGLPGRLHSALGQVMPATCSVIYEYDATTDELTARSVCGRYAAQLQGLVIPLGHRVTGWVAAQRSTIVNSDAALDLGSLTMQLNPPPRSCLSTALWDGDRLVGALTIYSTTADAFVDWHSHLVEALAPRIASALRSGPGPSFAGEGRLLPSRDHAFSH